MKLSPLVLFATCLLVRANAAVFDFETSTLGVSSSIVATNGGLTLTVTSSSGSVAVDNNGFPALLGTRSVTGTNALHEQFSPLTFSFSAPVSSVTFLFGDLGGDDDSPVHISAYNSSNVLLSTINETHPAGFSTGKSAVWSGANASYFVMGTNPVALGSNPNSLYFEVSSATAAGAVPDAIPTFGALAVALAALVTLRRNWVKA